MLNTQPLPPHASLLHELLLALVGHTGDVFVDSSAKLGAAQLMPDPMCCTVRLASDIDWVDSPDRYVIHNIF